MAKKHASEAEEAKGDPGDPQSGQPVRKKAREIAPARQWCFTWHDYPENWAELFQALKPKLAGYIIGCETCPTTQRVHMQGWIEMNKKGRPMSELKLPREVHWDKARGTPRENYNYCTKEGLGVEWGTGAAAKPYKVTLNLYEWELTLIDFLISTPPEDRTIY